MLKILEAVLKQMLSFDLTRNIHVKIYRVFLLVLSFVFIVINAWHAMETNEKKYIKSINRQRISKILSLVLYNFYLSSLGSLENCNWELRLKFLTNILLKIEFLKKIPSSYTSLLNCILFLLELVFQ